MRAVLRSIKPYWLYLIIIGKKTIEVGKDFPKAEDWSKDVVLYCSKDMKSFNRIPEKDREWMRKYLGKCACRFVCNKMLESFLNNNDGWFVELGCLTPKEIEEYQGDKAILYGWHISDLVIYDKPKLLRWFQKPCICKSEYEGEEYKDCLNCDLAGDSDYGIVACNRPITRPPQSWCYVEKGGE